MKKIHIVLLLTALFIFSGMKSPGPMNLGDGFIGEYAGTINQNIMIQMSLTFKGNDAWGSYFYEKVLQDIIVKGNVTNDHEITLNEFDVKGNVTGAFKGKFLTQSAGTGDRKLEPKDGEYFAGIWSDITGKKQMPFELSLNSGLVGTENPVFPFKKRYSSAGLDNFDEVEQFARTFKKAVLKKEKTTVASMISYPINVEVDGEETTLKNIKELIAQYDKIFHETFYKKVSEIIPHNMFSKPSGVNMGGILINGIVDDKTHKNVLKVTTIYNSLPAEVKNKIKAEKEKLNPGKSLPEVYKAEEFYGAYAITKHERVRGGLTTEDEAKAQSGRKVIISSDEYKFGKEDAIKTPFYKIVKIPISKQEGEIGSEYVVGRYGITYENKGDFYYLLGVYKDKNDYDSDLWWTYFEIVNKDFIYNENDGFLYNLTRDK